MTGTQLLDMVMLRLVRSDSTLRAGLLLELNQLLHTRLEVSQFIPWFLYREDVSTVTVVGQETVEFPTGFIRFDDNMENGGAFYQNAALTVPDVWVPLIRGQYNEVKALYSDATTGVPAMFAMLGTKFHFRPIPDGVYPLKIAGMFRSPDITDTGDSHLWGTHAADLLLAELTLVGATLYTRDADLVQIAMAERNASMTRLRAAHTAFMESMQERNMGVD